MSLCEVAAEGVATVAPPKRVNNIAEEAGLGASGSGKCSASVCVCVILGGGRSALNFSREEHGKSLNHLKH